MKSTFLKFLAGEVIAIVVAITVFSLIHTKIVAGVIAGVVFTGLGLWIVGTGIRFPWFRRTGTFALGCVHLFVVALPMMITRLMNAARPFEDIKILGLPGPVFHSVSTGIYFLMMIASVVDALLAWRREKTA